MTDTKFSIFCGKMFVIIIYLTDRSRFGEDMEIRVVRKKIVQLEIKAINMQLFIDHTASAKKLLGFCIATVDNAAGCWRAVQLRERKMKV